jgi:hypothetical protein
MGKKEDKRRWENIPVEICGVVDKKYEDCIFFEATITSFPTKKITCKYRGGNRCYYRVMHDN